MLQKKLRKGRLAILIAIPVGIIALVCGIIAIVVGVKNADHSDGGMKIVSAELAGTPKTEYEEGESFLSNGLAIKLTYANGSTDYVYDFSVDKTGALTQSDTEVKITYGDYIFPIALTVMSKPDIVIANFSQGYFEEIQAEDLDRSRWVLGGGHTDFTESFQLGTTQGTSVKGGAIVAGSEVIVSFRTYMRARVNIVGMMSRYEADYSLTADCDITLDGKPCAVSNASFGTDMTIEGGQWWNWRAVSFGDKPILEEGLHVLKFAVKHSFVNCDAFRFYVSDPDSPATDVDIDANGTYRVETENLDKAGWYLRSDFIAAGRYTFVEGQGSIPDSNGQHTMDVVMSGSCMVVSFQLQKAADVSISLAVGAYVGSGNCTYDVAFDSDAFVQQTVGYTSTQWQAYELGAKRLEAGTHTFTIRIRERSTWTDYIDIAVSNMA